MNAIVVKIYSSRQDDIYINAGSRPEQLIFLILLDQRVSDSSLIAAESLVLEFGDAAQCRTTGKQCSLC